MALIGLKYLAMAVPTYSEAGEAPTYTKGQLIGKSIKIDKSASFQTAELYADDELAESDKTFDTGTLSINLADYGFDKADVLKVQALLFGHELIAADSEAGTPERLVKSADDVAPYLSAAYIKTRKLKNVVSYEVTVVYKVQFAPSSETAQTKEKSTTFNTPTAEGSFYPIKLKNAEGNIKLAYEDTIIFDDYSAAINYIKTLFSIT